MNLGEEVVVQFADICGIGGRVLNARLRSKLCEWVLLCSKVECNNCSVRSLFERSRTLGYSFVICYG